MCRRGGGTGTRRPVNKHCVRGYSGGGGTGYPFINLIFNQLTLAVVKAGCVLQDNYTVGAGMEDEEGEGGALAII